MQKPNLSNPLESKSRSCNVISANPCQLPVTTQELFDDLVYGFRICGGGRSSSIRAEQFVSPKSFETIDEVRDDDCSGETSFCEAIEVAASAFDDQSALELTAGADSRLVLAMALAGGARIRRSFTVDIGESEDPKVASLIAQTLGIKHLVVAPDLGVGDPVSDAHEFARASGWVCNAVAYGCLPSVFRQLAEYRTSQVGGVGGEIGTGFYRTDLDRFARHEFVRTMWRRIRLRRPNAATHLFRPEVRRALARVADQSIDQFFTGCDTSDVWRHRTDQFYLERRIQNWALPVLSASAHWYEPRMPLLSSSYAHWAFTASPLERNRGRQQHETKRLLNPILSTDALAVLLASPNKAKKTRIARLRRVWERAVTHSRPSAPIFESLSKILMQDGSLVQGILKLSERGTASDLGLCPRALQSAIADPSRYAFEIGALATAAFSHQLVDSVRPVVVGEA